MSRLLTPPEAAEYLAMSERTLREHVKAQEIKYVSIGRGVRRERRMFDPVDLDAFIAARKRVARARPKPVRRYGQRPQPGAEIYALPERASPRKTGRKPGGA